MASLKEKYGEKVKFYFVEYNREDAIPVIEKFNIQSHPETFILDENDELIFRMEGLTKSEKQLGKEIEKALGN
ncbi:hypothetical protein [Bacillus sp. PS06]|uniref:hypothetical protein n=1 Tax=Bacillus sp. PS06 TaxID=2764176 RepID=UPI00178762BA|nr:hypothetical protein [Bacillus sp. PS06]MBD8067790.1 hypothetical protein [Bacillus sp. PS06]